MTNISITRPRDVQIATLAQDTTILRSRTWERLKFEIEYSRQRGTTSNSYLIQSDKTALIDPPGESFTQLYLEELSQKINLQRIDYIILSHVNTNRMATVKAILDRVDTIKIICSRPGAISLKETYPEWENRIEGVKEDTLDLGQGHELQFIAIPTPRWADGMAIYDPLTRILYTDKLFGAHICDDALYDEDWKSLQDDRNYYFECLHAPQAKQVESAIEKLAQYSARIYAVGHGPLVRYSLSRVKFYYQDWCEQQQTKELSVALIYASAYGNTTILASAIAQGLVQQDVSVYSINCEFATPEEIQTAVKNCDGFIIGSPTLAGHPPTQIQTALGIILSTATKGKIAGVFGSYGWSGEAVDLLETKLKDANFTLGFPSIRVKFTPTSAILQQCEDAGAEFAQALRKLKKQRTVREGMTSAQSNRTEQAVGRIVGSLCVISTKRGETHHGVLTSFVSQASFHPPGLMLSIGEGQEADIMIQAGQKFVLNILREGRTLRRYFATTVTTDNPFAKLETEVADNGCLILKDALAYLQCTVVDRIVSGDRWLVYATVDRGDLLDNTGVTAVLHRKSGIS